MNKKQIKRQDFVDNSIFELLQALHPTDKEFDWDIEMIADVRDGIQYYRIEKNV
ncbi:MAG: hypothetical protein LBD59_05410 [Prevotellaceae bacterium]|nr:hypothetical protein [Prevotellaceae bacterium]